MAINAAASHSAGMPLAASDPIRTRSYRSTNANQVSIAMPCACTADLLVTEMSTPTPAIAVPARMAIAGKIA